MSAHLRLTLLGTGSSGGVPRIGGDWGACDPNEPRNRRSRCSVLVERYEGAGSEVTCVLIDTSPDVRDQLLKHDISTLDAVVFTHDHADQTHGIDDLRPLAYRQRRRVPAHMDGETATSLRNKFRYIFEGQGGYPPILDPRPLIVPGVAFSVEGPGGAIELLPLRQIHGSIVSLGFRIGPLAYCNDVNELPPESLAALEGIDTFIVDALRYTPHASHAHLDQALAWADAVSARRTILTNLHIDMDYRTLIDELPTGVEPGYDGMGITIAETGA